MIRAQIYLTTHERRKLTVLAHETGKSKSELIREAIDQFIETHQAFKQDKLTILRAAKGLWANRDDLPDFKMLRKEFDKRHKDKHE
ncbi:MAG: CopG family transcriptional regulator [Gammaproteobacteria bacterium RIFCSPHIGHO2_12_FULL_37_34]|nr:MAG: CopG family transcriptional regulator [Gammaproteobacteria bacterium RIFCSPHIGHO2_12_FULL_37_34]